tara:strand:+ start:743 stop:931 length:189 start_codon:yes stop_codon:yes gene_type:complete
MNDWVQDLGVVGVLSIALIFTLKYVTQSMSWEIKNLHEILVKLIDKMNTLKEAVDRLFNEKR